MKPCFCLCQTIKVRDELIKVYGLCSLKLADSHTALYVYTTKLMAVKDNSKCILQKLSKQIICIKSTIDITEIHLQITERIHRLSPLLKYLLYTCIHAIRFHKMSLKKVLNSMKYSIPIIPGLKAILS